MILKRILFLIFINISISHAKTLNLSVEEIGKAFRFPSDELVIQDVSNQFIKAWGDKVIEAYDINSKTKNAFYRTLVIVASEGAFLDSAMQSFVKDVQKVPEGLLSQQKRGPYGPLEISDDLKGGIYSREVLLPSPIPEMIDSKVFEMGFTAELRDTANHIDIKMLVIPHFDNGDILVKVPNGEMYYESMYSPTQNPNEDSIPKKEFDYRSMFITLAKHVSESAAKQTGEVSNERSSEKIKNGDELPKSVNNSEKPLKPSPHIEDNYKTAYPIKIWLQIGVLLFIIALLTVLFKKRK